MSEVDDFLAELESVKVDFVGSVDAVMARERVRHDELMRVLRRDEE